MTALRLPTSAVSSLIVHGGFFAAYMIIAPMQKKDNLRMIANVDLLVAAKKPAAAPSAPVPASRWNFLKMALPAVPKPAGALPLAVKLPERLKIAAPNLPEKIEDRGRLKNAPKLEVLDLNRRLAASAMSVESKLSDARRAASLTSAPVLEEVGAKRVRNLPQALALEENRREAAAMQALQTLLPVSRPGAAQLAPAVLREAMPGERGRLGDKMPALAAPALPQAGPMAASPGLKPAIQSAAAAPVRRKNNTLESAPKKGVEIEGPLADRKIASYEIPEFPAWARAQGMLEASVSIRFYVAPDGSVLSEMRVESTSGFGRLDRLAMDSLSRWRFISISSQERQWGVITFRFVME